MSTTQEKPQNMNAREEFLRRDFWLEIGAVRRRIKGEKMEVSRHAFIPLSTPTRETASSHPLRIPRYAFQDADSQARGFSSGEHHGQTEVRGFSIVAFSLAPKLGNYPLLELDRVRASLQLSGGVKTPDILKADLEGSTIEGIRLLSLPLRVDFGDEPKHVIMEPDGGPLVETLVRGEVGWEDPEQAKQLLERLKLTVKFDGHTVTVFDEGYKKVAKIKFGEVELTARKDDDECHEYERVSFSLKMADVYFHEDGGEYPGGEPQALAADAENEDGGSGDGVTIGDVQSDSREG